ncbi:hypothetical protein [Pseudoduganella plicata]|uniref:Uncharacterized protein n=1 Tax=Pseudoduganella plicata TaxID=321984 RepID=A0ABX5SFI1_9BURK|nr:hypothetical protein [Pseudoduganella plicata]QBQ38852.1 hypothetical protein E1742_23840 [Pseudoduganella plicata]
MANKVFWLTWLFKSGTVVPEGLYRRVVNARTTMSVRYVADGVGLWRQRQRTVGMAPTVRQVGGVMGIWSGNEKSPPDHWWAFPGITA